MRVPARAPVAVALAAALALSACKSPEEKAEAYYLSGVELVKADDPARAMVQFRNALLHDPDHRDAVTAQAALHEAHGDLASAYAVRLRLAEARPEDLALQHDLAALALRRRDWEAVERHAAAILGRGGGTGAARVARVLLDYRQASQLRDQAGRRAAAEAAVALRADRPADPLLLRVSLDWAMHGQDDRGALALLDDALARTPEDRELQMMRLSLLARTGAHEAVGERLARTVALFPEDRRFRALLVDWLVAVGRSADAEALLRGRTTAADGPRAPHEEVLGFLLVHRGRTAATAEADRLAAAAPEGPARDHWRAIALGWRFEDGDRAAALDGLRAVVAGAAPGDDRRAIQVRLARMLDATGAPAEADALLADVLAADAAQPDALRLRAQRRIAEGRPSDAVIDLRAALAQRPRDPDILVDMARAHRAEGRRDLARERLATAVAASGAAPGPSLIYAAFLREEGRDAIARRVLGAARARAPGHPGLLAAQADLAVSEGRFGEAAGLVAELEALGAAADAARLHAARLAAQGRHAEGLAFLEALAAEGGDGVGPLASVVQGLVRAGRTDEAVAYVAQAAERTPDDPHLPLMAAAVAALTGDAIAARTALDARLAAAPGDARAVSLLVALLRRAGDETGARDVLAAALTAAPADPVLRLMEASRLEAEGDAEAAIAVLDGLLSAGSDDPVVANNLAALLARSGGADPTPERVARARAAAKGLRGLARPEFQDTYGWVALLAGDLAEARAHLAPAAAARPADPVIQYHLGRLHEALGRVDAARASYARVAELDAGATLPETLSALERLDADLPAR